MTRATYSIALVLLAYYGNAQAENNDHEIQELKASLEKITTEYEQRLKALENQPTSKAINNGFNPDISLILDGRYSHYNNKPENYELPGFALGGEAGLADEGFSLNHTELSISANIDDKFHGKFTAAIAEHDGETDIELEEAYVETLGLGEGFTIRGGRFFSSIGYLNQQHAHAWDFADAPLVYGGLWGNKYLDDGLRLSWLAPTDLYIELGTELFAGGKFPAGGESSSNIGSQVFFAVLGGDLNESHSWQTNLSYHSADVDDRESGGHDHGAANTETPSFSGDSDTYGLGTVYKWAPNGNAREQNFKIQAEYFYREEDGLITLEGSSPLEQSTVETEQKGYYLQAIYQFMPQWRVGLRYDHLSSDNQAADNDVLEEAGLFDEGINPKRSSAMLEWVPSEYSRIRLQYNHDESYEDQDDQLILQYTMSLGAHGAHTF